MTNRIALFLVLAIVALFLADRFWLGLDLPLFLGRKLMQLVEYMAFWR